MSEKSNEPEFLQWDGTNAQEVKDFTGATGIYTSGGSTVAVGTPSSNFSVRLGHWIIKRSANKFEVISQEELDKKKQSDAII